MSDTPSTPDSTPSPAPPEAQTEAERLVRQETRQGNAEARQGNAEARMGRGDERVHEAEGRLDAIEAQARTSAGTGDDRAHDAEGRLDAIEALAAANIQAMKQVQGLRADITNLVTQDNRRGQQQRKNRMAVGAVVLIALAFGVSDRRNVARFEQEAIATDQTFCALANDNRFAINRILGYNRADQMASKKAYTLALAPRDDDDQETRQRKMELLRDLIGTLDAAPVGPDLEILSCEGIGNKQLDFSRQLQEIPIPSTIP